MPIKIVQFTHPGGQSVLSKRGGQSSLKEWNIGSHCRNFLIAKGQYVTGNALSGQQDLLFWGEWEPDSKIIASFNPPDPVLYPTYLHSPFLRLDKGGKVIKYNSNWNPTKRNSCSPTCSPFQNTDPFVFDEYFLYSLCRQETFASMKNLDAGSIILFGSTISAKRGGPYFVLDTVFVVGEKRSYTAGNWQNDLSGFIPKYYDEIMGFGTWMNKNIPFTCYKGATFHHPVDGMYSFVPCKTVEEHGINGFSRAVLKSQDLCSINIPQIKQNKRDDKFISDNLNTAPNYTASDLATNKQVWDKICQIIDSQGFKQGMNFKY